MSEGWRDCLVGLFMGAVGCAFLFMTMEMWRETLAELTIAAICAIFLAKNPAA